jgi:hypothetical protein
LRGFGLLDLKVLLLEKPGGVPKANFTETRNYRLYSQKGQRSRQRSAISHRP